MKYCNYEASLKTRDQEIKLDPLDFELIEMYSSEWEDEHNPPFDFCRLLMEMIELRFSDVLDEGDLKRYAASILNMNYFKFSDYIIKAKSEQINKRLYAYQTKNLNLILNSEMEKERLKEEEKIGKRISPLSFKEMYQTTPSSERRIKKALAKLSQERINEINSIVDEYLGLGVDCCSITASKYTKDLPIGASKLGGLADIPEGERYPLDKNGLPMRLLCQLNLKEVAKILPSRLKRKEGLLSFFLTTHEIFIHNEFRNYAVRYYEDIEDLVRKPFPHNKDITYHESEIKLNLRKSIPNSFYSSVEAIEKRIEPDWDLFHELITFDSFYIHSHFLGFTFTSQSHAISLNDKDITDEMENLTPLLTISSQFVKDAKRNIKFGDGDSIGFFIKPEDLENWNFRNVAITLYS